ncbi:hypothetical protein [Streptomyces decoyicus]|uniref:hypothetical protein n=1 Tax=Streptomyces decoyicus TaxID=249567 RepID=UPI0037FE4152
MECGERPEVFVPAAAAVDFAVLLAVGVVAAVEVVAVVFALRGQELAGLDLACSASPMRGTSDRDQLAVAMPSRRWVRARAKRALVGSRVGQRVGEVAGGAVQALAGVLPVADAGRAEDVADFFDQVVGAQSFVTGWRIRLARKLASRFAPAFINGFRLLAWLSLRRGWVPSG